MKRAPIWLVILLAAAFVLGVYWYLKPEPKPVPRREQRTIDSLAITKPEYTARRDTLVRVETTFVARAETHSRESARLERVAAVATARADSLEIRALRADSIERAAQDSSTAASLWHATADARKLEADTLRVAFARKDSAYQSERKARLAAGLRAVNAELRLDASEDLSRRLARDVAKAGQCRVLFVVRCLNRKETAIAAAVLTYVVVKTRPWERIKS